MFDLAGFLSGLIGATIGGLATFGVALSARLAEGKSQRAAAVAGINRAVSVLLTEGASRTGSNPNTDAFFAAMRQTDAAVVALRLVLRRRDGAVADWVDREVREIADGIAGDFASAKAAVERARCSTRTLAEWAAGRESASSFRRGDAAQDAG